MEERSCVDLAPLRYVSQNHALSLRAPVQMYNLAKVRISNFLQLFAFLPRLYLA